MSFDSISDADSIVDAGTIKAYQETDYQVGGLSPFVLRVGEASASLAAMHEAHGADCSAFITAYNPFSKSLDTVANDERHSNLARELEQRGLVHLEGVGGHPSNNWPEERSFLGLGITLEAARALGNRFEQNAIIWSGFDATPRLILLR